MRYLVDTNVILDQYEILSNNKYIVCSHALREIEKHEHSSNQELSFKARQVKRFLNENSNISYDLKDYTFNLNEMFDGYYEDNRMLQACVENGYGLVTNDILLKMKAEGFDIEVIVPSEQKVNVESNYKGVKDIYFNRDDQEELIKLASVYESSDQNMYGLALNEYVSIWDTSNPTFDENKNIIGYELIDQMKWDGNRLVKIKYRNAESRFMGKVSPINYKQRLLFDLLQNRNIGIKLCLGNFGTGKDYSMVANMLKLIEDTTFDKMVFIRNTEPLEGSKELGYLPGDLLTKMEPWVGMIADCLGGYEGLRMLVEKGKIEIANFSALRGRSFANSILYCSEGQNLSSNHIKLIISRVGQGSELWINGDLKQRDNKRYDVDSGIRTLYKLKGHKLFGMVTLDKNERSSVSSLVELL
jgi:predicted ribonuclease YlaK